MPGGALIASGEHGCIFNNMPDCKSRRNSKPRNNRTLKVSKLLSIDDPSSSIEISNSAVLKHIPNYEDYFILIDDFCQNEEKPVGWQNCSLFKPGAQRVVKFMQLRMLYGGERLYEYARDRGLLIANWLKLQIRVAEALQNLHIRGWIHGDLHHGNIVVDEYNNARLIDFGQSYRVDSLGLKSISLTFLPDFDNYAPELDYIAGVRSGLDKIDTIHVIFTKKKILRKIDEIFPSQGGVLGDLTVFSTYTNVANEADAVLALKRFAKSADIWTVGYNFFNLYMELLMDPVYTRSEFYKRNHEEQMRVLRGMLHPDPRQRMDVSGLLKELYSMRMMWV